MIGNVAGLAWKLVIAPSSVLQTWRPRHGTIQFWDMSKLTLVYLLSTIVIATPWGLAYQVDSNQEVPLTIHGWLEAMFMHWTFVSTAELVLTSLYIIACFHLLVTIFGKSRGLFQSYVVLVYGTGYYLSVFWLVGGLSALFFKSAYVRLDVPPSVYWATITDLTTAGFILVQVAALVYTAYSLYLGARINHRTGRVGALIAATVPTTAIGLFYGEVSARWGDQVRQLAMLLTDIIQ